MSILRHDVDHSIVQALYFAEIEAQLGMKSTFFLLHSAKYFDYSDRFAKKVKELSEHADIGLHNDAIGQWIREGRPSGGPQQYITRALDFIRSLDIECIGTASHGSRECHEYNFVNYELWTEYNGRPRTFLEYEPISLGNFGLEYEAYFLPRNAYLSDSGGYWAGGVNLPSDAFEDDIDKLLPDKVFIQFEEHFKEGVLQILIHPFWWRIVHVPDDEG